MAKKETPRRSKWKLIAAGAGAVALVAAWHFLPLRVWFKTIETWTDGLGGFGPILYGLLYLVAEILMVPGAILMIGAGYLFGTTVGMAVVWPAATLAAAISFLVARHLAREKVERLARRHRKFKALDGAIGEGGWQVVALLRFSPIVPFGLSNYLYGLSKVRIVPYITATAFGMLPGAFLYVYLGATGQSLGRGEHFTAMHWVLIGVGLVATAAVSVYLARVAQRRLQHRKAA